MKRKFLLGLISAFLLLGMFCTANATPTLDQGQIFGTSGVIDLGTDTYSQSITTGIKGELHIIQFQFDSNQTDYDLLDTSSFTLSVLSGGDPTTWATLFSESLAISEAELDTDIYSWDISSANRVFDIFDVFTFQISVSKEGFFIAGNDSPGYLSGDLYKNGVLLDGRDMGFRTYVNPVPEPSTMLLLGVGLIGLAGITRRKLKR